MSHLGDEDAHWLVSSGTEMTVSPGAALVEEGTHIDQLFFVVKGLFRVTTRLSRGFDFAKLGPGEIVGDLSFIDRQPTSASVIAEEESQVLAVTWQVLNEKMEADSGFAASFYRALSQINARRLRSTMGQFGELRRGRRTSGIVDDPLCSELGDLLTQFKESVTQADAEALKNDGMIPDGLCEQVETTFRDLRSQFGELMYGPAGLSDMAKNRIGAYVRAECLPYLLLTETAERFYSKPRGYAGDFLTIEMIYDGQARGHGRIGRLIDRCFLNASAAKAVRNRRSLLAEEILRTMEASGDRSTKITSLACGPAREVFDVYDRLEDGSSLRATLLDIDFQALSFVDDIRRKRKLDRQITLLNENLAYLAIGRRKLDLRDQDLVYSIGLIDYFPDRVVAKLINYIHGLLKPGGRTILGNFHPKNTDRAFMDYVVDWELIHRSEEDMNRLFEQSEFGTPCTNVRFEEEGINLFAECVKR